jgi:hypothetical protein
MIKPLFLLAALCSYIAIPVALHAEDAPIHTVEFTEGDCVWSVSFETSNGNKDTPHHPSPAETAQVKVEINRQGDLRFDRISWSSGKQTSLWWIAHPAVGLVESEKDGKVHVVDAAELTALRFDASAFQWIGPDTFADVKRFRSKRCQYYEADKKAFKIRAWIDAKTHQPVALDNGIGLVVFKFKPDAMPKLPALPEPFQKALDRYRSFYANPQKP